MDEAVHVVLGNGFGDPLGALDMDVLIREVSMEHASTLHSGHGVGAVLVGLLCRVFSTDQIVDTVGMSHTFFKRLSIPQIIFLNAMSTCVDYPTRAETHHKNNPAQISSHLEMPFGHFFSVGYHDGATVPSCREPCQKLPVDDLRRTSDQAGSRCIVQGTPSLQRLWPYDLVGHVREASCMTGCRVCTSSGRSAQQLAWISIITGS